MFSDIAPQIVRAVMTADLSSIGALLVVPVGSSPYIHSPSGLSETTTRIPSRFSFSNNPVWGFFWNGFSHTHREATPARSDSVSSRFPHRATGLVPPARDVSSGGREHFMRSCSPARMCHLALFFAGPSLRPCIGKEPSMVRAKERQQAPTSTHVEKSWRVSLGAILKHRALFSPSRQHHATGASVCFMHDVSHARGPGVRNTKEAGSALPPAAGGECVFESRKGATSPRLSAS